MSLVVEALAALLRPGNAGRNTAADHQSVLALALAALPAHARHPPWRAGLSAGADPHRLRGRHPCLRQDDRRAGCGFSLGCSVDAPVQTAVLALLDPAWTAAHSLDGEDRNGAWLAEITDQLDLSRWPACSRVIVRRERPHPGARLRFTDSDGHRFTAFITDTGGGELAELEVRHRSHARVEDRIRCGKATGLRNMPSPTPTIRSGSSCA